jgi:hypothetical protein
MATKRSPAYEDRLCLFLDILGFKSLIDGSAKDSPVAAAKRGPASGMSVQQIHSALTAINRAMTADVPGLSDLVKTSKRVTQFSDSIVVSYRLRERGAAFAMLYDIYLLQIDLIRRGVLVRGAIAAGKLFHDAEVVFGPALVDAAELENLAMYPRVILGREIVELASKDVHGDLDDTVHRLVKQDLDGMFFIDYFGLSPGEFDDGWDDLAQHVIQLREVIKRLSQLTRNPSIRLKHSWMRQKFNDVAIPMEKSRFNRFNGLSIPDETQSAFVSAGPFR